VSSPSPSREVIHRARALLAEGRALLEAEHGGEALPKDLLGLYDALIGRLGRIDNEEIGELLAAVSDTVDELGRLAEDLDRGKRLRSALAAPTNG
jgi:flagellin-specific chaperone FliS